ncbi:hypothetical protein LIER_02072 [Lithospermum erythrorhizon]|uniref:Uncharacterized protein n=1 Tax=Lithospermum erythrorhizon TaxID=34254 RepID=A0AAV3NQK4_LITER
MELEDKMSRESEMFEMKREAMQKTLKVELRKLRECHMKGLEKENDFMEKKLSWVILEKLTLEEELRKRSLEKSRENYEEELKRECHISENKPVLAASEKRNHEEELSMRRIEFEDRIEVLERKNSDLNNELELYKERFCNIRDFVEQIKGVYYSTVNGNVSSYGDLSMCKLREREKRGCSFLEDEFVDGGYNDNNLRFCYNRPLLNDFSRELDVVDGIGHCSAHSRVDSCVDSSENQEVAGFQTSKGTTWNRSADMFSAFRNDPELCLAAVCTLYRQHISAENPSNRGVLGGVDIDRSVLEVQRDWPHGPHVLQICERLAIRYKEQLFEIYQKKLDPFFCMKS